MPSSMRLYRGGCGTEEIVTNRWSRLKPSDGNHPYLKNKGIKPNGARIDGNELVVPVRDSEGNLQSLQFISPNGDKKFHPNTSAKGGMYTLGGVEGADAWCIAEGFATGASLHEATGLPVAVAFSAGNLQPVAEALRREWPDRPIVLCADDDADTAGNPGVTKAREAAQAVGGRVAIPGFGPDRPQDATDFNDLHRTQGSTAIEQQIERVIEAAASEQSKPDDSLEPATFPPPEDMRPCFRILDAQREVDGRHHQPGVYSCGARKQKNGTTVLVNTWICSPLHVDAVTHDGQEDNFGRLLRFQTTLGNWREWAMPMELLCGTGEALRGALLAMGMHLDPIQARRLLPMYLQHQVPKRRVRCAMQTGWADAGAFVLPDTIIGPGAAGVAFQSIERGHAEYVTAGTLDGWRQEIAACAVGNPLLTLVLSAGFAGPLLHRVRGKSGGVHFVGDSSTGKSTLVEAACSIWGGHEYKRSWRATANGMEGAAALFNDGLLVLDEISECDPAEVGRIIYALGNGVGKQRASRSGAARSLTRWRCVVLSSGERTVETSIRAGGGRIRVGQTVRLVDVPVARRYGVWDDLRDLPDGAALSNAIRRAATAHYGHSGRVFLDRLTRDDRDWSAHFERTKAPFDAGGDGQAERVAARFALYGMAGELATEYGLTGWPAGDALGAATAGFQLWRSQRGSGKDEKQQIIEQVLDFIDRHGDAWFSDWKTPPNPSLIIRDRAGWWKDTDDGRTYLFTPDGLREALNGFDCKRGLDALQDAGMLPAPETGSERRRTVRIAGDRTPKKIYPITIGEESGHES